jgi:phosphatidylserine/phosphatidylglycerophosphate/cardiolipin synthase-like enzyme
VGDVCNAECNRRDGVPESVLRGGRAVLNFAGMQSQSLVATIVFAVIAFGGGYLAGSHGSAAGTPSPVSGPAVDSQAQCFFSPGGGCTDAIVGELNVATHSIELQGYSFTSRAIGSALVAAQRRGVNVRLVLDAVATSENRKEADYCVHNGVPVFLDSRHGIAHNKVILIDERTLITGSFNFTRAAEEQNAENLLILHDQPKLQSAYEENFRVHLSHSEKYDGK